MACAGLMEDAFSQSGYYSQASHAEIPKRARRTGRWCRKRRPPPDGGGCSCDSSSHSDEISFNVKTKLDAFFVKMLGRCWRKNSKVIRTSIANSSNPPRVKRLNLLAPLRYLCACRCVDIAVTIQVGTESILVGEVLAIDRRTGGDYLILLVKHTGREDEFLQQHTHIGALGT